MHTSWIRIVGTMAICLSGMLLQAQSFTITSDKESGTCGNQFVTFEAGFIEVATSFSFNSGVLPVAWASSPYTLGQACSGVFADRPDGSDYFWATINDSNGHRFVSTNAQDMRAGGQITFSIRFGRDDPSSGCENPDEPSEGVYLQYSTDGGVQWNTFEYWVPHQIGSLSPEGTDLYRWNEFTIAVPEEAKTSHTSFRWFQPSNSGSSYDNWGLDDISVFVLSEAQSYVWEIGDGKSYEEKTFKASFESGGAKTVKCTVVDSNGQSHTSAIAYEVVIDDEAPLALAKDHFLILDQEGQATLIADYLDGGSTDNCSEILFSIDKESFSCADLGDNTVTLTVTDNAGNASTTSATVSVYDFTAPQVIAQDIVVQLDEEGKATIHPEQVNHGSSDACSDTLTFSLNKRYFTKDNLGENAVILTATDESGNQATARAVITVEDKTAPKGYTVVFESTIVNAENSSSVSFSISGAEVGSAYAYTISSGDGGTTIEGKGMIESPDQQWSGIDVSELEDGELTLSLILTDASGNTGEAARATTVKDTSSPAVEIASSVIAPTNQPFSIDILFSESVVGLNLEDIGVDNASTSHLFTEDQKHFTVEIHPLSDGLVIVNIADGVVTDEAGNSNQAASANLQVMYDASSPTGYTLYKNLKKVSSENVSDYSFQAQGLEVGTQLYYTISSAEGGTAVEGTQVVEEERQAFSSLDLSELADGELTLSFYLVDKAGNQGEVVIANTQKSTVEIVAVEPLSNLEVPFATSFEKLNLPEKVEVTYSTGTKDQLGVEWNRKNFSATQAGEYILEGRIRPGNCINTQNFKAHVKVKVGQNLAPTQIRFSATTFSPTVLPDQAIGSFASRDEDDSRHIYTLQAGEGDADNHLFIIAGEELFLKSTSGISGQTTFSIRVRSSDAYRNSTEDVFRLSKTPYEPESIDFVNTFSPNGDGINELWMVPDLKFFNEIHIEVFDRSGRSVFQTTDPEQGWDGSVNGSIQGGGYYYIITIHDIQLTKRGVLSVIK